MSVSGAFPSGIRVPIDDAMFTANGVALATSCQSGGSSCNGYFIVNGTSVGDHVTVTATSGWLPTEFVVMPAPSDRCNCCSSHPLTANADVELERQLPDLAVGDLSLDDATDAGVDEKLPDLQADSAID